ncbi:MAG TPA: redoxin domain-containing protein [Nitrospiria bacterium]
MKPRIWHIVLIVFLSGLLSLFYKGLWGDPRAIPTVLINAPAQTFLAPEVTTGEMIPFDRFKNKVILLNFWASWCLECRDEHPNLLEIQKRFGKHPDFVMLGVNYQDRVPEALRYLDVYGNTFQHVRDIKGDISIDYGVYGVPETFIIDRQGVIRHKFIGPLLGPVYRQVTESILPAMLDGKQIPAL